VANCSAPSEEVRHVGDAIAFVVADTIEQAKDGAEAIIVAWEKLPHVIGAAEALKASAPLVWQQYRTNVVFDVSLGNKVATSRAF
jgi:carbon-monoxide dehydrogenase large subunit